MPVELAGPLHAPAPRRGFLQRLAALSATVAAGGLPSDAHAQATIDPWLAKLTGKHKQVFDAPAVDPFSSVYAATYMRTMTDTYKLKPGEVNAVVVYRHFAMPLLVNDDVWAKYKLGAMLNVTDPATKGPSTRNIFYKPAASEHPFPDFAIAPLSQMPGAILLACGVALSVISSRAAQGAGVDADTAAKEFTAGLIPGAMVAPSGVLAVGRAQERGCSYCFAG